MKTFAALILTAAALLIAAGPAHAHGPRGYSAPAARVVVIEGPTVVVRHYRAAPHRHAIGYGRGWGPSKHPWNERSVRYYRPASRTCLIR